MSKKNNQDNLTDDALFAAAMSGVEPLRAKDRGRIDTQAQKEKTAPLSTTEIRQRRVMYSHDGSYQDGEDSDVEIETALEFMRSGVQASLFRKLRRAELRAEDAIDLHGMNGESAMKYLHEFLNYSTAQGYRVVRVVHGKGYRSDQGPVLKRKIGVWLRQRSDVLAYCSAQLKDGGVGAVYVLLARSKGL